MRCKKKSGEHKRRISENWLRGRVFTGLLYALGSKGEQDFESRNYKAEHSGKQKWHRMEAFEGGVISYKMSIVKST